MTTRTTNVLASPGNTEIAFIDTSIAGYQTLLDGLREGVEAVLIDGAQGGLAQIAAALAGRSGIEAVHVFTHGAPGVLQLGATRLDEAGLADHEADLAVLRSALADGADLLLYGCDVAAGAVGESFLQALSTATGADVAASVDPSGSALLGGDWELEAQVGAIEANSALAPETLANFSGLLAVGNLDFDGDGYELFGKVKEVTKDGWTFTSTVAIETAILDENSGIIASMMRDDGRLDDGIMWLNYQGLDENQNPIDAREFSMSSADGSGFKLESLRLGQLVGSAELPTASTLTITAYRNNKIVGVAEQWTCVQTTRQGISTIPSKVEQPTTTVLAS